MIFWETLIYTQSFKMIAQNFGQYVILTISLTLKVPHTFGSSTIPNFAAFSIKKKTTQNKQGMIFHDI